MLELRHLRTLIALRDSGSLVEAAERVHLTQSALSHQLKELENRLGDALFVRKTRPVQFTPCGQRLLALAEQVLPQVRIAERDVARLAARRDARLHMAIECHSCFQWLMPTIDAFRHVAADVEIDILGGNVFEPLNGLVREQLDLVITADPQALPGIHYQPLFRYQSLLAVAPDHPFAGREWIEPEELRDQTLIIYPVEHTRLDVFTRFLTPAGVYPQEVRSAELTMMMMQLVASGRGVCALPNWALTEYLERDYVNAVRLGEQGVWGTLYAAIRGEQRELGWMQAFLDTAKRTSFEVLDGIEPPEDQPLAS
ncbi:LysR family transcriptional regulator [Halotalea alkalilenta]|uniref:HTH-type transcriptional regulator MetR n=1 Tax=Halotalea alkalilenta TaxID=376489 RepID=A0A172YCY6_9GAMM|nr:LysR family transcriptional regulator [Halotalea alkalilenta]ANF56962.1 XRE family transcriptional regulator [Halotalea alkalilenta]